MGIFKKRESIIQNITYMAIMAAINVVFVLLTNLVPGLLFLLVLLLPLTSALVALLCKKKYYLIYAIVTLGLCVAVGAGFSIFDALIYVFPSLVVGFIFGVSFEFMISAIYIVVGTSIVQFGLSYLTLFVLSKIVTNLDIMNGIISLFGLTNFAYVHTFTLVFIYIISQIQIILSYLFIKISMNKIGIEINLVCQKRFALFIVTFIMICLSLLSYFYFPDWTLVFIIIPLIIYVYELIELILKKRIFIYIAIVLVHILFIFLFAFLYQYTIPPNQLIILTVLTGLVTIIDFLCNYCFLKYTK